MASLRLRKSVVMNGELGIGGKSLHGVLKIEGASTELS